jgi:hypothetical protein
MGALSDLVNALKRINKPVPPPAPAIPPPLRVYLSLPPETMEILIERMKGASNAGDGTYWTLNGHINRPDGTMIPVHILK